MKKKNIQYNQICHCERPKGASQSQYCRNNNEITTSKTTFSPRNDIFSFFEIEYDNNFFKNIFKTLKEIIDFDYGSIVYNSEKPEYTCGKPSKQIIKEDLKIKNTKFGELEISANSFSKSDIENFKSCGIIISNIIKDYEISKIMKMQVEALQEGYLKVKQSEEVKTKFISNMSHELRTPLNSILGFSELLENEFVGTLNEKQKEYINDIRVSGLNLLNMINEILDMSKIEANAMKLNITEFQISRLIFEAENIINPLLIKNNIKLKKSAEDFSINADYQKLKQILLNLLSNAIKFTKNKIEISTRKEGEFALISVKDNGIGINPKNFDKIFNKFEQLDKHTENSTGLGLAITKEFVKMHDGEIFVESENNKGCKFVIKCPLKY